MGKTQGRGHDRLRAALRQACADGGEELKSELERKRDWGKAEVVEWAAIQAQAMELLGGSAGLTEAAVRKAAKLMKSAGATGTTKPGKRGALVVARGEGKAAAKELGTFIRQRASYYYSGEALEDAYMKMDEDDHRCYEEWSAEEESGAPDWHPLAGLIDKQLYLYILQVLLQQGSIPRGKTLDIGALRRDLFEFHTDYNIFRDQALVPEGLAHAASLHDRLMDYRNYLVEPKKADGNTDFRWFFDF